MVSGLRNFEPALPENDENCDGATTTSLADEWIYNPNPNSSIENEVMVWLGLESWTTR